MGSCTRVIPIVSGLFHSCGDHMAVIKHNLFIHLVVSLCSDWHGADQPSLLDLTSNTPLGWQFTGCVLSASAICMSQTDMVQCSI